MGHHLPRVTHLDCLRLDDDIERHFSTQMESLARNIHPVFDSWGPELRFMLKLALLRDTMYSSGRSIGQKLLSCHYFVASKEARLNPKHRLLLHLFANGLATWLHQRLDDLPLHGVSRLYVRAFKACSHVLQSVNAFAFFYQGNYASVGERLFGMTMKSSIRTTWNSIPHAVLARELLWNGLAEFLLFLWPLIRRSRWLARLKSSLMTKDGLHSKDTDDETCLLCRQTPKIQPHQFCAHSFCYYCVTTAFVQSEYFTCPACGEEMTVLEDLKPACSSFEI